jgi:hypothetical protein
VTRQLTPRQAEILRFMWEFFLQNDQLPTHRDICERFGFVVNASMSFVAVLQAKGYIERNACPGRFKFTQVGRTFLAPVAEGAE